MSETDFYTICEHILKTIIRRWSCSLFLITVLASNNRETRWKAWLKIARQGRLGSLFRWRGVSAAPSASHKIHAQVPERYLPRVQEYHLIVSGVSDLQGFLINGVFRGDAQLRFGNIQPFGGAEENGSRKTNTDIVRPRHISASPLTDCGCRTGTQRASTSRKAQVQRQSAKTNS
ncbi:hypothetical protein BJ165DRAFT_1436592 [Panaeolus papilionaceus]|nr:hypothetical protein BJ165DRAFT_1436592 [Panaeolus papilionaceus]